MSDDIVTQLRAEGQMENVGDGTRQWEPSLICNEAANEIERLRKIISDLKGSEMCDPNDPCEMCKW